MANFSPKAFRKSRLQLGMTQEKLAEALGISFHSVWSYEKGRRPIPRVVELAMTAVSASRLRELSRPSLEKAS